MQCACIERKDSVAIGEGDVKNAVVAIEEKGSRMGAASERRGWLFQWNDAADATGSEIELGDR